MALKIDEVTLRNIIVEELSTLREVVDHEGAKHVVTTAAKLLKALEAFKEKEPTPAMMNAVVPHLEPLISMLEAMIQNPSSYVVKVKAEPRRVKLRAVPESRLRESAFDVHGKVYYSSRDPGRTVTYRIDALDADSAMKLAERNFSQAQAKGSVGTFKAIRATPASVPKR